MSISEKRAARIEKIRVLAPLGFTAFEMAELLGCKDGSVSNDLKIIGGLTSFHDRSIKISERYKLSLSEYAKLSQRTRLNGDESFVHKALHVWLKLDDLQTMVKVVMQMEEVEIMLSMAI